MNENHIVINALAYVLASEISQVIEKAFKSSFTGGERDLLNIMYNELKDLKRAGIYMQVREQIETYNNTSINIYTKLVDGKLFVNFGFINPFEKDYRMKNKPISVTREIGDIVFIIMTPHFRGYTFIQVKHSRNELCKDLGESIIATRGSSAANKGQLLTYSGFIEQISPNKNAEFFRLQLSDCIKPFHFYLFSVKYNDNETIILMPSTEILLKLIDDFNRKNSFNRYVDIRLAHPTSCFIRNPYQGPIFKITRTPASITLLNEITKMTYEYKNKRILTSKRDTRQKIFDGIQLNNTIKSYILQGLHRSLLRSYIFNIINTVFTINSNRLNDPVKYRSRNKTRRATLGEVLDDIFNNAITENKISSRGYRNSIIMMLDPPCNSFKSMKNCYGKEQNEGKVEKRLYEVRELLEEDFASEEFDIETDKNDKTLLIIIKMSGKE